MTVSPRAHHSHKFHKSWDNIAGAAAAAATWSSSGKPSRRPPKSVLTLLFLLALWIFWTFFLPVRIFGFLPLPTGYPRNNLRRTWVRVRFGFQFRSDARRAAFLPRYRTTDWPPPIFVVSLARATERRASVTQQMADNGIPFEWWDAVDGLQPIPLEEVAWYTSGSRLRAFKAAAPGSHPYLKAACDLSHLRLMHDMVAAGRDLQVVLEDDLQLLDGSGGVSTTGEFLEALNATLHALPEDWDILWLNHGNPIKRKPSNLVDWVGPGVRTFLSTSGTVGMVYRRSFALRLLNEAQIGDRDIDNVMNDVGQLGMARAYVADPPLVREHEAGFASQIEIQGGSSSGAEKKKKKVVGRRVSEEDKEDRRRATER